ASPPKPNIPSPGPSTSVQNRSSSSSSASSSDSSDSSGSDSSSSSGSSSDDNLVDAADIAVSPDDAYISVALIVPSRDEPHTYAEAIHSEDRDLWMRAMQEETNSILQNRTWRLVDAPPTARPIGVRWIFKIKRVNT